MNLDCDLSYKKEPLLTPAEEIELSKLIKAGMASDATRLDQKRGERAKARIIRANMRFVITLANTTLRKHRCNSLTIDDLIQEGVFGLNRAAELFDHTRGYKFSTYCYAWVNQSLRRAIGFQDRIIRLPIHVQEELYRFKRASEVHGATMNLRQIMEAANVTSASLELGAISDSLVSSNVRAHNDGDELIDLVSTKQDPSFMEEIGWDQHDINIMLSKLDEKERKIICWYYGLNGTPEMGIARIAQQLKVCRKTASQMRDKAHEKLRDVVVNIR
jgi:RNA polymerase primary sigma factor